MTSKAERIRTLLDQGKLSTQEIADRTGVHPAYVRSVKQRRDPNSWCSKARRNGDRAKARREGRWAYTKAILAGDSPRVASSVAYPQAYRKALLKTGREKATS